MSEVKKASPARQLMALVWNETNRGMAHSWSRLNHAMSAAVVLACQAGFKFDEDDFAIIAKSYNMYRWGGNDGHMLGEHFYTVAVKTKNLSACKSFEAWKKRKPFLYEGDRLALQSTLNWNEHVQHSLKVTSFSECGTYLTACSYDRERKTCGLSGHAYYTETLKHRVKITCDELHAENRIWTAQQKVRVAIEKLPSGVLHYLQTGPVTPAIQEAKDSNKAYLETRRDLDAIKRFLKSIPPVIAEYEARTK